MWPTPMSTSTRSQHPRRLSLASSLLLHTPHPKFITVLPSVRQGRLVKQNLHVHKELREQNVRKTWRYKEELVKQWRHTGRAGHILFSQPRHHSHHHHGPVPTPSSTSSDFLLTKLFLFFLCKELHLPPTPEFPALSTVKIMIIPSCSWLFVCFASKLLFKGWNPFQFFFYLPTPSSHM